MEGFFGHRIEEARLPHIYGQAYAAPSATWP
jgi:hypothetical protein